MHVPHWLHVLDYGPWRIVLRSIGGALIVFALFLILNYWPRIFLRTPAMLGFQSPHFVVWAENSDRRDAIWLRTLLEDRGREAANWLGFPMANGQRVQVFLYPDQSSFQIRRGGTLELLRQRALYYVDHIGAVIVLTAPNNAGPFTESGDVMVAALDEYIRSLLDRWPLRSAFWLREGMVLRLGSGDRFDEDSPSSLPTLAEMTPANRSEFAAGSGPLWADAFVAWLELKFGKDKLLELLGAGGDYKTVLGSDLAELFPEWIEWIKDGQPRDPRRIGGLNVRLGAS